MFSILSDEELQTEIAPGRNRVYYLLGHLTAHHDCLLPLLGIGSRLHPELDETFIDILIAMFPKASLQRICGACLPR